MKILSNYTYKVNFGYDKKLNEELKSRLNEYPDRAWAQSVSSLNSFCNRLETNIVREEKATKKANNIDSKLDDYIDMFLSCKEILVGYVSVTFEDLNFADREFIHYQDSFEKNGKKMNDWRKDACESLKAWVSPSLIKKESPSVSTESKSVDSKLVEQQKIQSEKPNVEIKNLPTPKISFLEEFKPSSSSPKGFIDVAGMQSLKDDLKENVIEYIINPEQAELDFVEYGKTIPKGILLFGPPGCGKTYITQALASEIDTPMYLLNISKAGSHYINMTSKNIKAAFDEAIAISENTGKKCLLFMDEIDSLGFDRSSRMEPDDLKQVSTMLQAIDKAKDSNVIIIGATNKFNLLDPAIRRRFDTKVFVDVPDVESINSLLVKNLQPLSKGQALLAQPEELLKISKLLKGYSNSSICNISKDAALNAMKRGRADISFEDYEKAVKNSNEEKPDSRSYKPENTNKSTIGFQS